MSQSSTRRSLLKRGALLLAGAIGAGGASGAASAAASTVAAGRELTLYGRGFHLHSPQRRAGVPPARGEQATTYGELLGAPNGTKVGEFRAGILALGLPFGPGELAPATLEQHVFTLKDGTIIGLGSATAGEGTFAVVGGTGSYAGARGTYTALMRTRELGGNGLAEFRVSLVT